MSLAHYSSNLPSGFSVMILPKRTDWQSLNLSKRVELVRSLEMETWFLVGTRKGRVHPAWVTRPRDFHGHLQHDITSWTSY